VFAIFFVVFIAWLGGGVVNRTLFNFQDVAGLVCRESKERLQRLNVGEIVLANGQTAKLSDFAARARADPALSDRDRRNPFKYVPQLPEFRTSELCQSMKVMLERNGRYLIRFESTESFRDGSIPAAEGFYSTEPEAVWRKGLMAAAVVPLRRELARPWFRVVARMGGTGGEESFLDPDPTGEFLISEPVKATRDGELFLFVNDAVIGIPGLYKTFYRNNRGSTRVLIQRQ
jgi:hypothetical protein